MNQEKLIKFIKNPTVIVSFLLAVCLIIFACQFASKKLNELKNGVYQKGVDAGQNAVAIPIIRELLTTGKVTIYLPVNSAGQYDANSTTSAPVILVPQK
jgi:hypothetical protein